MFKDKWLSTPEPHDDRSSNAPLAGALRCERAARREARAVPGIRRARHPTLREAALSGERWVHEIKFDGYRTQAHLQHDLHAEVSDSTYSITAALNLGRRPRRPPVRLQ
jgi:ATP-dependent DNA ligase